MIVLHRILIGSEMLLFKLLKYDVNSIVNEDTVDLNMIFVLKFLFFVLFNSILFGFLCGDSDYIIFNQCCLYYMYCVFFISCVAFISVIFQGII